MGGHKLFTVILRDITERKRAEEVLRQSEEKFRALAEHTRASFGIIQGTRFVYANPYLAEVSGYTVPELLSMEFAQVVHPDFRPIMMERARRRQMGEPVPNHYEFKLLTKSGDVRWMDFSVGTILYEGKLAVIGSGFDITEHKRAVEAVRESQQQLQEVNLHLEQRIAERTAEAEHRAEQLRELASELTRAEQHERSRVAGILHDHLQQLLVGAKFGTSVLRGQLGDESQRRALQKVDDLLNESLETSRNLTIELSPPILHEGTLAAALHWLASWMHDKHGLQVHLKTDETLDPQDEGVRILLFESVRELLFNIVKHAGTDSACATLERCDGEHLRIIVADAGPGFDAGAAQAARSFQGRVRAVQHPRAPGAYRWPIRDRQRPWPGSANDAGGAAAVAIDGTCGPGTHRPATGGGTGGGRVARGADQAGRQCPGSAPASASWWPTITRWCETGWPSCCRCTRMSRWWVWPVTASRRSNWPAVCGRT